MPQETPAKEVFRFVVRTDGSARGVYSDDSVLKGSVRRASNVEFNNGTELWEARLNDGTLVATDPNRQECIRKEVEWLQEALRQGRDIPEGPGDQSNVLAIENLFKRFAEQIRELGTKILIVPELKPETARYHHMLNRIDQLNAAAQLKLDPELEAQLRQLVAVYWEAQEAGFPPLAPMDDELVLAGAWPSMLRHQTSFTIGIQQDTGGHDFGRIHIIKNRQ